MNAVVLLHERQEHGGSASYLSVQRRRKLTKEWPVLQQHEQLASSFGWNCRRMRNMILVVGPGTPASFLHGIGEEGINSMNHEDNLNFYRNDNSVIIGNGDNLEGNDAVGEEEEKDDSQESETTKEGGNTCESELGSSSRDRRVELLERMAPERATTALDNTHRQGHNHRFAQSALFASTEDVEHQPQQLQPQRKKKNVYAFIDHNETLLSACWLQASWRFSSVENVEKNIRTCTSYECPTQVLTVGADLMVRVWDVSGAMGMDRIIEGSWNTFNPYCNSIPSMETFGSNMKKFARHHFHNNALQKQPFGSVVQLAAVSTGSRKNTFHLAPLYHHPGKILTGGEDGCLRMTDLIAESTSVKFDINRYTQDHPVLIDDRDSATALSHTMLSPNTGILCSDVGLYKFDIRLSPSNQSRYPLISNLFNNQGMFLPDGWSKFSSSVAVWNPYASFTHNKEEMMDMESLYVFVGGSSSTVALWDVRMDGSSRGNVVELYKPEYLDGKAAASVSGLDVSRDGQELLVTYETDQIYTFPIGHSVENAHGKRISMADFDQLREKSVTVMRSLETSSFGGHFDRLTFMNRAQYAGPNDEYIVTGSDSGHAWIFERQSETVVSLLASDTHACQGIFPHPTLPFFITHAHGGDTFAKLWRATSPVDPTTDDSPSGRASRAAIQPYEESLVTKSWGGVQRNMWYMPTFMPDYFERTEERTYLYSIRSEFSSDCRSIAVGNSEAPRYHGNALESLSSLLTYNQYALMKSINQDQEVDIPVKSYPHQFCRHVSRNKLRQQADRLGLQLDCNESRSWFLHRMRSNPSVHAADLVPDCPSSWIRHDWLMNRYERQTCVYILTTFDFEDADVFMEGYKLISPPWLDCKPLSLTWESILSSNEDPSDWEENSRMLLYETALLLKEAGNEAAKNGQNDHTAARRYDKAIQYCAMALMHTWSADVGLEHLSASPFRYVVNRDCDPRKMDFDTWRNKDFNLWSPLLKILITCRLNLALLFLKKSKVQPKSSNNNLYQPHRATSHAREAVQLLEPFTSRPGKIVRISDDKTTSTHNDTHHPHHRSTGSSNKDVVVLKDDEPLTTFHEAYALQSKAFYRWGCASFETKDYASAVEKLTAALQKCPVLSSSSSSESESTTATDEALTVKKLNEAKRYYHESQKKRTPQV